ncbi:response regulator [Halobacterium salinarum]|nr:response regulator [Halobacterium salinarum]MBB6089212.1 DNA-binding response OmpR family regulator [Halobacterium salinarum]MDL0118223.1 response regulator [Halobacterium salinarum]MDL0123392.1 response regulator [Halobacterium salinarum]MDL0125024.1 response regulator [Halobacterium salinarum]MDL0129119.1 response regulator [Halobacterium salinarum]
MTETHPDQSEMRSTEPVVLVVDDEPRVAEAFALWLEDDYEVRTATSGAAALEAADDDVSVALLDRQMPTMTGDEVLAALRERALDIRVAMVTGIDPDFDIVEMPFDEYIQKPVDGDTLHDVVARLRTLNQYDDSIDELYRVTQKLATLEAQLSERALADNDEYQRLRERKATLSEAADAALDAAGTSTDALGDEFARLF